MSTPEEIQAAAERWKRQYYSKHIDEETGKEFFIDTQELVDARLLANAYLADLDVREKLKAERTEFFAKAEMIDLINKHKPRIERYHEGYFVGGVGTVENLMDALPGLRQWLAQNCGDKECVRSFYS